MKRRNLLTGAAALAAMPLARPHERAGLLSAVFVASYVALGVPAMVAGVNSILTLLVASSTGGLTLERLKSPKD